MLSAQDWMTPVRFIPGASWRADYGYAGETHMQQDAPQDPNVMGSPLPERTIEDVQATLRPPWFDQPKGALEREEQKRDAFAALYSSGMSPTRPQSSAEADALAQTFFAGAPIETNADGGMQSRLETRYDLIDPVAMYTLARVLWYGEQRYPADPDGTPNWHHIPTRDHINHVLHHLFQYLAGDEKEDHLGHAFARLMFAIRTDEEAV